MKRSTLRKRLAVLFDRQGGKCCYCDGDTWMVKAESRARAQERLGIPLAAPGSAKMRRAAMATLEHIVRRVDGGGYEIGNLMMACGACNGRRMDSLPSVHRMDMQVLVAAGLHPTNRPKLIDNPKNHYRQGLLALRKLRAGIQPGDNTDD